MNVLSPQRFLVGTPYRLYIWVYNSIRLLVGSKNWSSKAKIKLITAVFGETLEERKKNLNAHLIIVKKLRWYGVKDRFLVKLYFINVWCLRTARTYYISRTYYT